MSEEELRALMAQLALSHKETERLMRERHAQTELAFQETDRQLRETSLQQKETDRLIQELSLQQKETDRQIQELGQQIGGLGQKFGGFTEGMAFPSMARLLEERFGATHVSVRNKARLNGHTLELDVLATSNSERNEVYIVEVKSHLREDGLQQMLHHLERFPEFYPQYRDKKLYGILAAVDVEDELRQRVLDHGIYLARIADDTFQLDVPERFTPRSYA